MIIAKKNAAYYLPFPAVDSTTPAQFATGLSPVDTAYYKDGAGAWTSLAITDTATEIGSTGVYEIDLTAAEMNHDKVIVTFNVSGMAQTAFLFDLRTKLTDDLNDIAASDVTTDMDANSANLDTIIANIATTDGKVDTINTNTAATQTLAAGATGFAAINTDVELILGDTATDGVVLSAAQMNKIADHILRRAWATAAASADGDTKSFRSLLGATAKLVNKVAVSGTDLLTYEADDSTTLGTQALTTDATADPITAMDTTG
jgi:hypothetical protein